MGKSKVYTRTGDSGKTALIGGVRVSKCHQRIEAYGSVDELNACIALLESEWSNPIDFRFLRKIQNQLFALGSYLANPAPRACSIHPEDTTAIEEMIDSIDEMLPPLEAFVIPGGSKASALAHLCRTMARRSERQILRLAQTEKVDDEVIRYMNRLSDYLFVLSRKMTHESGGEEIFWEPSEK